MKRKLLVIIGSLLVISSPLLAQWECPSRLSGSLTPIGSSDLMWATEITATGGVLGDYSIANAMGYLGLDYTKNGHTIYAEGGLKLWYRVDAAGVSNQLFIPGAREVFYRYKNDNNNLTLGLQSAKSDEFYLLNERIVGLNYRYEKDAWKFNVIGGSVVKAFARNGTFCTLGYLYNVIPRRDRAILGNELGQTNLSMFTLAYMPTKRKKTAANEFAVADSSGGAGNEFSSEFSAETPATHTSHSFKCESIGLVGYDEFGSWIDNNAFLGGLYSELDLFQLFTLKPEVLYQRSLNNNAILYSVTAEKQLNWNNGQMTKFFARYIGFHPIDSLAIAKNSFSNVFAGEVIRLDALELPLFQAGLKHSFPGIKTSVKLQLAQQVGQGSLTATDIALGKQGKKMSEYDVVISKNFGKNLLLNATVGYLNYYYLTHDHISTVPDYYVSTSDLFAKLEMRLTF